MSIDPSKVVTVRYRNYRGEIADRKIVPTAIRFAESEWHPEPQWLLDAFDVDKDAERSFALKDVIRWGGERGGS